MTTQELLKSKQEQRATALAEVRSFGEKVENQTWKEETDPAALAAVQARAVSLENEIRALQAKVDADEAEARANSQKPPVTAPGIVTQRGDNKADARKEFRLLEAIGQIVNDNRLSGLYEEMAKEAKSEARAANISNMGGNLQIPSWIMRDMNVTTPADGGFTVQTDVNGLIPLLDPFPVVARMGVTMLPGLVGNQDFPRVSTGATATWKTENTTADETTPQLDRVQMSPNRLTAYTDVSRQLIIQAQNVAIENMTRAELTQAVSNALDIAFLNGAGGSEPSGLIGTSGVNTVTFQAAADWAKLVQMETEVASDNANAGTLGYLFHTRVMGALKTKERTSSNGIYLAQGRNNGENEVNGYTARTSTLVPSSGGTYYGFYGDWRQAMIGQWGGVDLMINPYTKAKEALVEMVINSYWDVGIRQPSAFTVGIGIHPS